MKIIEREDWEFCEDDFEGEVNIPLESILLTSTKPCALTQVDGSWYIIEIPENE